MPGSLHDEPLGGMAGVASLASPAMTTSLMSRQLHHELWATRRLIAHCRTLAPAQLALTVPGTYGTILLTLEHIVVGNVRYLARLGVMVGDPRSLAVRGASLDEIAALHEQVVAATERLLEGGDIDGDRSVIDRLRRDPADPPLSIESWVLLTQFVHHGSDHRAHIGTILGANGLASPDLDVWAYAREIGATKELR